MIEDEDLINICDTAVINKWTVRWNNGSYKQ
ncbi:hypothetical protein EDD64_1612 [Effusibacillus lacus]|nr:hypothetical protein EDD64_1612 [Effusibacillus lacus]